MCKFKQVGLTIMLIFLWLITPASADASYAYNYGRTADLNYADEGVYYAARAWYALGSTYSSYLGSNFTETRVKSNLAYGNGFYVYSHANADYFWDNIAPRNTYANAPGLTSRTDVANGRQGDWKRLVFLDGCDTADNDKWAAAFGIAYGDGYNHAYLGWTGTKYDGPIYSSFDNWFWWSVQNYSTISASANYASYRAGGATNWLIYGNGLWHY